MFDAGDRVALSENFYFTYRVPINGAYYGSRSIIIVSGTKFIVLDTTIQGFCSVEHGSYTVYIPNMILRPVLSS